MIRAVKQKNGGHPIAEITWRKEYFGKQTKKKREYFEIINPTFEDSKTVGLNSSKVSITMGETSLAK